MNYLRKQSLNPRNVFDDTVLQRADNNIELNPRTIVLINGKVSVSNDLTPSTDLGCDLGKINTRWKEVYAGKFVGEIYGGTY